MTPNGQAGTQYPHPLHTSCCTTTVSNSVRNSAPVGHTSRQAAWVQCLHTSEDINQRIPLSPACAGPPPGQLPPFAAVGTPAPPVSKRSAAGDEPASKPLTGGAVGGADPPRLFCSMKATWP